MRRLMTTRCNHNMLKPLETRGATNQSQKHVENCLHGGIYIVYEQNINHCKLPEAVICTELDIVARSSVTYSKQFLF